MIFLTAVEQVNELIGVLIKLVVVGGVARISFLAFKGIYSQENVGGQIKNTLIFVILAILAYGIANTVKSYLG